MAQQGALLAQLLVLARRRSQLLDLAGLEHDDVESVAPPGQRTALRLELVPGGAPGAVGPRHLVAQRHEPAGFVDDLEVGRRVGQPALLVLAVD